MPGVLRHLRQRRAHGILRLVRPRPRYGHDLEPRRWAVGLWLAAGCASCGDDGAGTGSTEGTTATTTSATETSSGGTDTEAQPPQRMLVTADWLGATLSLVDLEALAAGAQTRDEALFAQVDLSAWAPGPLEVEVTPDGATAVVSISPGFFDGIVGSTLGLPSVPLDGTLLLVDLPSLSVRTEVATAHVPMGIAIAPDGALAYTANYGHTDAPGTTLSIVDLGAGTVVEDIEVGARPEQVALSPDGSLGLLNLAGDGTIRTFATADVAGSLSAPLEVSPDPSDVAFIEGTDLAVVANSAMPFNYTVLDLSDPSAPTVAAEGEAPGGFPYGVTAIPGTTEFLFTVAVDEILFQRIDAAASPPAIVWSVVVPSVRSFPLGVAVDPATQLGFSGAVGADVLVLLPLDGSAPRTVEWAPGPTYVAIVP